MCLLSSFVDEIIAFEHALKEIISKLDPDYVKEKDFSIGFEGSFADRHLNPRTLKSGFLGNLVCCEGIVTRCSLVRPKIVKSSHYCPVTKKIMEKKYTDFTSYEAIPTSNAYPKEDENKNPLETEFGKCIYKDHQIFSMQELPECAPPGSLPRNVDIIADEDLADRCKPGDRVQVIGLFRVLPNKQAGMSTGNFRSVLIANNVQLMSKELMLNFEPEDIKQIRKMSRHKDIFELLARSLAPSIYGHEEIKKAILCLLLGGCEKILENGTRLRGDINILLIGDPSVAKSQMLRYVIHTAPRVVATTGRGSSGVGLTAAVLHDPDTGERKLEAGAMVLADRGIVCIDEFDKMTDIDRTAIHEVMEQGRISISKAGIQAKLNARCSVLAAANPVFGRYNVYKNPMENIGMQDSLLSRFDLIFVMLDEHNVERDRMLAESVLKLHRYRTQGESDGAVQPIGTNFENHTTFNTEEGLENSKEIYEKNREWTAMEEKQKILSTNFVRKYIHMAKEIKPILSEEASTYISERYTELRSADMGRSDMERTMPVTARQLETLIRLSTAIAKSRLAKIIELKDAEKAFELLYFACFKEKSKERLEFEEHKQKKKQNVRGNSKSPNEMEDGNGGRGEGGEGDDNNDEEMQITIGTETTRAIRYAKRKATIFEEEENEEEEENQIIDIEEEHHHQTSIKRSKIPSVISVDRYKKLKGLLRRAFDNLNISPNELANLVEIEKQIQKMSENQPFTKNEFIAAYDQLSGENIIFIDEEQIMLI
ncbi:DNA helicase [Meloidogyne graminicola]|uniref:DNA replication licensing factor MCM3 n=1 Tax=Meloidogyne graminicola TaxID=189291 RepID=A0A8T0A0D8_9BILA|nr:DNA helicase [Meloidogyne graminicola]